MGGQIQFFNRLIWFDPADSSPGSPVIRLLP